MMRTLASLVVVIAAPVAAQCSKPPIPAAGLPLTSTLAVDVTYSDGYRTRGDLIYPQGAPPACGWPLVVHMHGIGGTRSNGRSDQNAIAQRGFAVWAYDCRGQGEARTLNPGNVGFTFYGPAEKADLAEQVAFARGRFAGTVHATRVAVTGASQGGIHSWFAAAWSGRSFTMPGRGTVQMPVVDCVAPQNFIAEFHLHAIRGGTMFGWDLVNRLQGGSGSIIYDPAFLAQVRAAFLAQDPAGLLAAWQAESGRPIAAGLAQSVVPVLYAHAYLDGVASPLVSLQVLPTLPGTTPWRALLSTNGHGSPANGFESVFRDELRARWFDRFLWGLPNEVELEAPVVLGTMPLDLNVLNSASSLWGHRFDASLPPPDVAFARRWLAASGKLDTTPPAAAGATTHIRHVVNPALSPSTWLASPQQRSVPGTLQAIPLSERTFVQDPLLQESELGERARVSLRVVPSAAPFQLAALLLARIPTASADFMVGIGATGVLQATVGQPLRVDLELSPSACVLPAGTVLSLVVRNHWLREAPMPQALDTVPYFVSSDTQILHSPAPDDSWIDLPLRVAVRAALVAPLPYMTAAAPSSLTLDVRGGTARAGQPYVIAAGLSGQVPPLLLPGGLLPLELDALSALLLSTLGSPLTPGFAGLLDASGDARGTLRLPSFGPVVAGLAGQRLSFAAWIYRSPFDITGTGSAPFDLALR